MDRIIISDLLVRCVIGVNEDERNNKQDVIINIEVSADLAKPCRTDSIEDTLDYKTLKKKIFGMAEASQFQLVEALAEAVADICLNEPLTAAVRVRVDKPGALRFARSVAVEIVRGQRA